MPRVPGVSRVPRVCRVHAMRSWRTGWLSLRRGWWVGALVLVLVVLLAGAQYVRAARAAPYVATQTLQIALLEPPTASTSEVAAAQANAASIARLLSSGGLLAAPDLDAAIAARMKADDTALAGVTPGAVAAGLSATHDAATLTLHARWSSSKGADALRQAAVEIMSDGAALAAEPAVAELVPPGAVLQVQAADMRIGTAVERDGEVLAAARGDLLARIGLGLLAGLLAALGGGLLLARRSPAVVPSERAPQGRPG